MNSLIEILIQFNARLLGAALVVALLSWITLLIVPRIRVTAGIGLLRILLVIALFIPICGLLPLSLGSTSSPNSNLSTDSAMTIVSESAGAPSDPTIVRGNAPSASELIGSPTVQLPNLLRLPLQLMSLLWGAGMIWATIRWVFAQYSIHRIQKTCQPFRIDGSSQYKGVNLYLSNHAKTPFCTGILIPRIVLPELLSQKLNPDELDAVLRHEYCHIQNRDIIFQHLQHFASHINWWNPPVGAVIKKLHTLTERRCDLNVLVQGTPPLDYVDTLMKAIRLNQEDTQTRPVAIAALGNPKETKARIKYLIKTKMTTMEDLSKAVQSGGKSTLIATAFGMAAAAIILFTSQAISVATDASKGEKGYILTTEGGDSVQCTIEMKRNTSIEERRKGVPMENEVVFSTEVTIPSTVQIPMENLDSKHDYYVYFRTPDHAPQWRKLEFDQQGRPNSEPLEVELFKKRYVILRYAFNTLGERQLEGPGVEEGVLAVSHWKGLPYFSSDWQVWQKSENQKDSREGGGLFGGATYLEFHRYSKGFGFSAAPRGVSFDQLSEAPAPKKGKYRCRNLKAARGLTVYARVNGNNPDGIGYGKVTVVDVTESPPADIKRLD